MEASPEQSWAEIEVRLRAILKEELLDFRKELYDRQLDPMAERVKELEQKVAADERESAVTRALIEDVVESRVTERLQVAERNIAALSKVQTGLAMVSGTALAGLILGLLTHSIHL